MQASAHKTYRTHGAAKLVLPSRQAAVLDGYVKYLRYGPEAEELLLTHHGTKIKNYQYGIQRVGMHGRLH